MSWLGLKKRNAELRNLLEATQERNRTLANQIAMRDKVDDTILEVEVLREHGDELQFLINGVLEGFDDQSAFQAWCDEARRAYDRWDEVRKP